jgi:hypothetical protein
MGYTQQGSFDTMFRDGPMERATRRTTERVGDDLRDRVKRHSPVAKPMPGVGAGTFTSERGGRLPGTLRDSWLVGEVVVIVEGERMSIDVYTLDPVAPHVEWDTQPHLIVPKHPGGMLRYRDRHGDVVYAKVVHHPGTRGQHMMATSLVEVAVSWQEIGVEEIARWAREQAEGPR